MLEDAFELNIIDITMKIAEIIEFKTIKRFMKAQDYIDARTADSNVWTFKRKLKKNASPRNK